MAAMFIIAGAVLTANGFVLAIDARTANEYGLALLITFLGGLLVGTGTTL